LEKIDEGMMYEDELEEQLPLVHREAVPAKGALMEAQFWAVGVTLHVYVPLDVKLSNPGVQTPPGPGNGTKR
jgi:hypothetical protein